MLSKSETFDADGSLAFEFRKARLRPPKTAGLFTPQIIRRGDKGWTTSGGAPVTRGTTGGKQIKRWVFDAIDELSDGVTPEPGHNEVLVRKVRIEKVRERMVKLGQLDTEKNGNVTGTDRTAFSRARKDLISERIIAASETHVWRIKS